MTTTRSRLVRRDYPSGAHTYSLDGQRCPGVTTIVGASSPKGGMVKAAAKIAAQWAITHADARDTLGDEEFINAAVRAHEDEWHAKADFGREVHAAADALGDGQEISVAPMVAQYARHIVEFLTVWRAEILARECMVWHGPDYGPDFPNGSPYAGQFDLIANLADGNRWLIDYKTGSGVYPDVAMQLAAYRNAEWIVWDGEDRPMGRVHKTGVLHVHENGWDLIPVDSGPEVWAAFLAAMPLYRFHGTKYGYDRLGEPLPPPAQLEVVT